MHDNGQDKQREAPVTKVRILFDDDLCWKRLQTCDYKMNRQIAVFSRELPWHALAYLIIEKKSSVSFPHATNAFLPSVSMICADMSLQVVLSPKTLSTLNLGLAKGPWTKEEDDLLRTYVHLKPARNGSRADELSRRTRMHTFAFRMPIRGEDEHRSWQAFYQKYVPERKIWCCISRNRWRNPLEWFIDVLLFPLYCLLLL